MPWIAALRKNNYDGTTDSHSWQHHNLFFMALLLFFYSSWFWLLKKQKCLIFRGKGIRGRAGKGIAEQVQTEQRNNASSPRDSAWCLLLHISSAELASTQVSAISGAPASEFNTELRCRDLLSQCLSSIRFQLSKRNEEKREHMYLPWKYTPVLNSTYPHCKMFLETIPALEYLFIFAMAHPNASS